MDYEKVKLFCSGSMEGIFTAVYDGWTYAAGGYKVEIFMEPDSAMELFCTCMDVAADMEKAEKVRRTVEKKLGPLVYEAVCFAAVSVHPGRGTAIFQVLWQALSGRRCNRRVLENLADPYVDLVCKLRIRVWHELHRFEGFVRFREIGGGVLFSEIAPDNDILVMLAPHFSDRFPNESWIILDKKRDKGLFHPRGGQCALRHGAALELKGEELSGTEDYEELWRTFCDSITIRERCNSRLQQQFLPLKFRKNMTEFQ